MLKVGDNDGETNPVCDTVSMLQIQAGQKIELTCNRAGRYLMIQLPTTQKQWLHFCEIKAYECSCRGEIIKGHRTPKLQNKLSSSSFLLLAALQRCVNAYENIS